MTPTEDDAFNRGLDKMPVSGTCDAGCGQPATTWFGRTSCATCGSELCVARMQRDYDAMDKPDPPGVGRRLRGTIPVLGHITDNGRLLPDHIPPGCIIALHPNDVTAYLAQQLATIEDHTELMLQLSTLVASTFALGEIRGRLLALRDLGLITDADSEARGEAAKARYKAVWKGVFDAAKEAEQ